MNGETKNAVEVIVPEVVWAVVVREGMKPDEGTGKGLIAAFAPFHAEVQAALEMSRGVTDGANPAHQKIARACRLELRRVRISIEDARKAAKADALRYGKAVDGLANVFKLLCEPEEERLEVIEKHAERIEAARIAAMVAQRSESLQAEEINPAMYNLAAMDEATFAATLEVARRAKAERIEAARKAEADRVAREKAEAEERARIKAENERLKAEAVAREKAAAVERAKAEEDRRKIEAERNAERKAAEAAVKTERDARAKAEAEAKAAADEKTRIDDARVLAIQKAEDAKRAAMLAPDREKVTAFAAEVRKMAVPHMSTVEGERVEVDIRQKLASFSKWIEQKAGEL